MDDLVFSISLPSFNTLDLITPHRRNSSRGDWPPPTDAPYQPPPLRGVHPNFTRFTDGNTSGAQSTTENAGSGGFVSSRRTTPPRQLQNPPTAAANSRPRRILTAADFSGQYSRSSLHLRTFATCDVLTMAPAASPQSSSSESSCKHTHPPRTCNCKPLLTFHPLASGHSVQSSARSLIHLLPPCNPNSSRSTR